MRVLVGRIVKGDEMVSLPDDDGDSLYVTVVRRVAWWSPEWSPELSPNETVSMMVGRVSDLMVFVGEDVE